MEFKSKTRHTTPARVKSSKPAYASPANRNQQAQVQNILRSTGAQAKLTIGQPGDKYEQEADRVADQVMRMSDADVAQRVETGVVQPMRIQRMSHECEEEQSLQRQPEEEEEELQAKEMPGQTPQVTSNLESRINSLKGGGQPIDPATRSFFEPRFGHDFRNVRVHADGMAADTAKSINARAFTLGNHMVFGAGQYSPESGEGKRLLGHELTHVVQQGGDASTIQRDDPMEFEPKVIVGGKALDERLEAHAEEIKDRIQGWVEDGIGDFRDGIQDAVTSFELWYGDRDKETQSSAFVGNLVWAVLGAVGACIIAPEYALVAALFGLAAGASGVAATISGEIDPNANTDKQVSQLRQQFIKWAASVDRNFDGFSDLLRAEDPPLWRIIGFYLTEEPPLLSNAQEALYDKAGVPRPNQNLGETILSEMIYTFLDWERNELVNNSWTAGSPESIRYAMWKETVRKEFRQEASKEAERRLGDVPSN
ncbi:MAG: hypothetical protein AUJ57_06555 [Zetaproteobacteria bacterium CG1_02_53_45]|nr:MAG: hypothetical protein AUJ57_06555 [Zetaproteobacteria bacterium CG1_02_53_45]